MRFFKNCKQRNAVAISDSVSGDNLKNGLTECGSDVFFTINGKPYQGNLQATWDEGFFKRLLQKNLLLYTYQYQGIIIIRVYEKK